MPMNFNTLNAWYNLPAITLASTSAKLYPVPASGLYSVLPSPAQQAGNALILPALSGDISSGGFLDGVHFKLALDGVANNAQSETLTFTFYQVTAAAFATGVTSTTQTGVNSLVTSTALTSGAFTGKNNFTMELTLIWDSASKTLNGQSSNTNLANTAVATTHISTAPTGLAENDLNFAFSITAGTTGTGDVLGPFQFATYRQ
jgi:hypothetical protein